MQAKYLMVGDWVSYNETPQQILEISGIDDEVYLETDELVHQSEIQPIPLTPEILEKNGFRIIFDGELHVSYFKDIESFHTEVKVDKIGIYQKLSMLDGLGNGVAIVECKYVHQLQHALRLCGIEKEIIL